VRGLSNPHLDRLTRRAAQHCCRDLDTSDPGNRVLAAALSLQAEPGRVEQVDASTGQAADRFENRPYSCAAQRQRGKPLVHFLRAADLLELSLQAALQLAAFDDPGHLPGDGQEEVDVAAVELPLVLRLDIDDADHSRARDDRHGQHRGQSLLVDAPHPLEARLFVDVGDDEGLLM
jgi:hypothetical protein